MKHGIFAAGFSLIIILSIFLTYIAARKTDGGTAEIYSNGALVHTADLSAVTEAYQFTIENDKHRNVVLIENGRISMEDADCPDRLCVKQGAISGSAYPIVCLPNKIVIKIRAAAASGEPDAVSR